MITERKDKNKHNELSLKINITKSKHCTKMKFFIKCFFSKCNEIRSFFWIWSNLLKKSLRENLLCSEGKDTLIKNENFVQWCVCVCVCVCVCLRRSTVKPSSVWKSWDCQGTDQRCCVEDVGFLCRFPSFLLWNAEHNLSASGFILFAH